MNNIIEFFIGVLISLVIGGILSLIINFTLYRKEKQLHDNNYCEVCNYYENILL